MNVGSEPLSIIDIALVDVAPPSEQGDSTDFAITADSLQAVLNLGAVRILTVVFALNGFARCDLLLREEPADPLPRGPARGRPGEDSVLLPSASARR